MNQYEELRHERKFLISDYSSADIEQIVKFNPACFTEIYHQRTVNNIYFDSLAFDSYYDNIEGNTNRTKARIRWYGNLFGEIKNAVLEFKIKKGLLGRKEYYSLNPFILNADFSKEQIISALDSDKISASVKDMMRNLYPALLNSYNRKYFLSADKNFRLTIDQDQTYYRISYNRNTFLNKVSNYKAIVLELKYSALVESEANKITDNLPFAMTKNSKYLQGIERVLF